jgi:hypothetical protein
MEMRCAHDLLASFVELTDDDHVAVVGMAETATGLGYGVFESLMRCQPDRSAIYAHTTRYWMNGEVLTFEEGHSHAPSLCLHLPKDEKHASKLNRANVLILVDDELSTGETFSNLVLAYKARYPSIERVHIATLADFLAEGRKRMLLNAPEFLLRWVPLFRVIILFRNVATQTNHQKLRRNLGSFSAMTCRASLVAAGPIHR